MYHPLLARRASEIYLAGPEGQLNILGSQMLQMNCYYTTNIMTYKKCPYDFSSVTATKNI